MLNYGISSAIYPTLFSFGKKEVGHKWAQIFIDLKAHIDRPLSAILSMNNIAHTLGAAGFGAQAVHVFGEAYFGLTSAVLTIII